MKTFSRVLEFLHSEKTDNPFHSSVSLITVAVSLNRGLSNDYHTVGDSYILYVRIHDKPNRLLFRDNTKSRPTNRKIIDNLLCCRIYIIPQ
jgi:hypothetical protein